MAVLLFLDGYSYGESALDQVYQFVGKAVGKLQVLGAVGMTPAAVTDDHVHVVGRDITAPHVTVIIVFPVEWADWCFSH
jgi:hypothetical protein